MAAARTTGTNSSALRDNNDISALSFVSGTLCHALPPASQRSLHPTFVAVELFPQTLSLIRVGRVSHAISIAPTQTVNRQDLPARRRYPNTIDFCEMLDRQTERSRPTAANSRVWSYIG